MSARPAPHVPGLPVLGSALDLRRDQLGTYERAMRRYGDVVRFTAGPPGWRLHLYAVLSAEGARHVLIDAPDRYSKDTPAYQALRAIVGNGLLTSQGPTWRRQRRFVAPLFTPRRLDAYTPVIDEEARALVERWRAASSDGTPVDAHAEMVRFTLRVVARALLGADIDAAVQRLTAQIPRMSAQVLRRGLAPHPLPLSWPTPANLRAQRTRREMCDVVDELVAARAADDREAGDLLGRLVDSAASSAAPGDERPLSDDEVRDQVLVFLLAGHETTASMLACALHLLGTHPAVQHRLRKESAAHPDGPPAALPYGGAVVREALRLYPPVYAIPRLAVEDDAIDGIRIPAGSVTLVVPWAIHRHPRHWPEPERFDPDRFSPAEVAGRSRHAWLPFGLGARACIGLQLALNEAVLALHRIVQAYEVVAPRRDLPLTPATALRPAGPVPLRLLPAAA